MKMEKDLIHLALENLRQITGIEATWQACNPLDGALEVLLNGQKLAFIVAVKREVRVHNLNRIEELQIQHADFLLIAHHIFPKIKEELRQKEIPYLEANGNVFLKKKNIFLFVDTQKPLNIDKNRGNRAFTKTGLKVLFYLLQNKEAINHTQRELAEKANVGLGNIPQVIEGLKETGYIIPLKNKTYVWENRKALLDRWVIEYGTVLRPKLIKEQFALKGQWQEIQFDNKKTVWGGESAADILTNHLRPEKLIIFTQENRVELIRKYRLLPDKHGEIEVLDMFWKHDIWKTAPPLLVYADLILEGGKRNKETAEKIFHDYIQPNL
jgi:hypothetical protein